MGIAQEIYDLLEQRDGSTRIALVGANNRSHKFGNIILRDLVGKGFTVLPVNPREKTVAGLPCYATVNDAPGPIHIVNFVVPPSITLRTLKALDPAKTPVVWFQPGAYDRECLTYAEGRFPHVIDGDCIMIVAS